MHIDRTQRLYAIGAASRQELEALEAERTREDQAVETARARLVLLGIPEERTQRLASPLDVVTTFDVRAPIAGVITKRIANPGLNVATSFRVGSFARDAKRFSSTSQSVLISTFFSFAKPRFSELPCP